ncbi:hypothetical protein BSG1_16775 [Bacillus sp. SG-1]|nr:hypothetical protein BSG1_16775 [Bacillus sp. SG-1]
MGILRISDMLYRDYAKEADAADVG